MSIEELYSQLERIELDYLIIVEGVNDMKALRELGVDCSILPIDKMPLYKVVDKAVKFNKVVILLLDFDKEGFKLYRYFYHHLTRQGIKIDNGVRDYLSRLPVKQIEELNNYVRKIESKNSPLI